MNKILVYVNDKTNGIAYYRTAQPFSKLAGKFEITIGENITTQDVLNGYLDQYKVVVFNRVLMDLQNYKIIFEYFKKKQIKVVCDIDDWWFPTKQHPSYNGYFSDQIYNIVIDHIKYSDYVLTTSETLAEELRKFNKNITIIPNAIAKDDPQFSPVRIKSKKIRIGWAGGSSHLEDIRVLQPALDILYKSNYIDKIQFILAGFDVKGDSYYEEDGVVKSRPITITESPYYDMEQILSNGFSNNTDKYIDFLSKYENKPYTGGFENETYRRIWAKPIHRYGECYNQFDICLAPLYDSHFNKCKSNLKALEAGFHNIPIIAQDIVTYNTTITNAYKNGKYTTKGNGLLVPENKPELYAQHIMKLVDDIEFRQTISDNLTNDIKSKYTLENVNKLRVQFLNKILK